MVPYRTRATGAATGAATLVSSSLFNKGQGQLARVTRALVTDLAESECFVFQSLPSRSTLHCPGTVTCFGWHLCSQFLAKITFNQVLKCILSRVVFSNVLSTKSATRNSRHSLISLVIHFPFNTYTMTSYCVPGTVGCTVVDKTHTVPLLMELLGWGWRYVTGYRQTK